MISKRYFDTSYGGVHIAEIMTMYFNKVQNKFKISPVCEGAPFPEFAFLNVSCDANC